ncbi:MAG: patatin-like phospholipase family protein [Candidatus Rokubacteria bacterium]|nr:patatin-like phospholipase family protein [Candidatus Rokubacteria bacterium]MBI3107299.1 patatin-like phospholipase family protein [Candidatus Rokubacteria bacterium]
MLREWLARLPGRRAPAKRALVLAGGGVIGGMYEVGALAALDEDLPEFRANDFDLYVGSSAGSVVAALMANGVPPLTLYRILEDGRDDPLNFQRSSVFHKGAFAGAARNFAQLIWAVGKNLVRGFGLDWPDLLARSQDSMPDGFFSVRQLEEFMRRTFSLKGLSNDFRRCPRTLMIPAMDLDRAERVVFGVGRRAETPISEAIAASSAIPGFFAPFTVGGRDYVDGDVGHTGHTDLAVDAGARLVLVVNPLVPLRALGDEPPPLRKHGFYGILEQVGRINSQNLLELGLRELALRRPDVEIHLLQPPPGDSPLFGPSMGFEASRLALQFGYSSTKQWLAGPGAGFGRRLASVWRGVFHLDALRNS